MEKIQENIMKIIEKIRSISLSEKTRKKIDKTIAFFDSPRMGVLFWEEFLICFGMIAVVEDVSNVEAIISICCCMMISYFIIFTLKKIKRQKKRMQICMFFLIAVILFFSMIYRPYTYSFQLMVMFALFCASVFVLINIEKTSWLIYIFSIIGQIVDSRYVCMMFLPLVLMYSFLERKDNVNSFFWIYCFFTQIIIGATKVFILKENVIELYFAESPLLHYSIPYFCLFILAYLYSYFVQKEQRQLKCINIVQFIGMITVLVLARYTESGYLYGVMLLLAMGIAYIDRTKWNKTIQDYRCDKQCFIMIALCLVWVRHFADLQLQNSIWYNKYAITHYYIEYEHYGFVQRGLVGTIIYKIFGYYISISKMNHIINIAYGITTLLVMCIIYCIGKKTTNQNNKVVQGILIMIAITPAIGGYMNRMIFQFLDIYSLLIGILCILILIRKKFIFLVPVLSCLGMLNHQIFVFLFFPMIFSVMLYQGIIGDQNKKRYIQIIFFITTIMVFGLFVYIQFFSGQRLKIDMDTAIQILRERTGGKIFENMTLWKEVIFQDLSSHLKRFHNGISGSMVVNMVISLIYSGPLIALYIYSYITSIKKETQITRKMAYVFMMLSVLAILPCYILETDYFRWTTNLLFMLFMGILVLTIVQKNEKVWYSDINQNKLENWMLCIAIMLGCYQDMGFSVY